MKDYLKYIILLFLVVGCSTSKNIQMGLVKFKLHKQAVRIENTILDPKNKRDQKIINQKNIYKIDEVYFAILDPSKKEIKKDLLEGLKKGFDYQMKDAGFIESHEYKSSLEKINNNDTFIMYEYFENMGHYTFKMVNKDNTQIIGGTIVFEDQSYYEEATKILNDFLKSVKFE